MRAWGLLLAVGLFGAQAPAPSHPAGGAPGALGELRSRRPIHLSSERGELLGKKSEMLLMGHVKARRDEGLLTCDQMTAFYRGTQENITRLVCDGNVEVVENDRWGRGEHAELDNLTGVLVFTGHPEGRQGVNHFHASKVTFWVGTDELAADNPVADLKESEETGAGRPDGGSALAGLKRGRRIHLTSDKLDGKKGQMVWRSHVKAKRDDALLSCDRMTVFYAGNQDDVTALKCDGNVEVQEQDRWGRGDHADFDNVRGVLVLTGHPEARQGLNHFRGTKLTFWVGTDQVAMDNPVLDLANTSEAARSLPKSAAPPAGKKPQKPGKPGGKP